MPRQDRIAAVKNLVRAAADVVAGRAFLAPAIVDSTGLSPEGVELALTRHVEVDATDDDLSRLVDAAGDEPEVRVILAANVFVGALRAIALARAAAPRVIVRPSRRDPTFARALVSAAEDPGVTLVDDLDPSEADRGALHVYGRDETIADVRARARVRVVAHASGMGAALVEAGDDLSRAAGLLADDVVPFDQRGCLSPRVALVEGDDDRARAFADALHEALEAYADRVPRGPLSGDDRAASGRYVATMTYASSALVGRQHAVGVGPFGAPLVLPPPHRHVHVAPFRDAAHAVALLAPLAKGLITLGALDTSAARAIAPSHARVAPLGAMQRPPLDGPVDLRAV